MTESKILRVMNEAAKDRVSITIAHRLSTIMDCDKILVMKAGFIVETGRHDELLQIKNGVYKSLWDHQCSISYFERDFETTFASMDMNSFVGKENIETIDDQNTRIIDQSKTPSHRHLPTINEKLSDSFGSKNNYHAFDSPSNTDQSTNLLSSDYAQNENKIFNEDVPK